QFAKLGRRTLSRSTVRQALAELERNGYIWRTAGSGTFLASLHPRIDKPGRGIPDFNDLLTQLGYVPSTQLITRKLVRVGDAGHAGLGVFQLRSHDYLVKIEQLRLGNGVPLALQTVYVVPDRLPGILDMAEADLSPLLH